MSLPKRPTVFFSHSWEDNDRVRPLAAMLERGTDVWFDQWEIKAGDSIVQKMNQGLSTCKRVL